MITWKDGIAYLGNRELGRMNHDGLAFVIHKDTKLHYFKIFKGWGFNKELIEQLRVNTIEQVRIVIDKGRKLLITNPLTIIYQGKDYFNEEQEEEQIILAEKDFDKKFERIDGELNKYLK